MFLLLTLNKKNPGWVVRVIVPKEHDIAPLLIRKNVWFLVVRSELRTGDTSKENLFAKIISSLKSVTICTRSSVLTSITGYWICLGYFSDLDLVETFWSLAPTAVTSSIAQLRRRRWMWWVLSKIRCPTFIASDK